MTTAPAMEPKIGNEGTSAGEPILIRPGGKRRRR